MWVEVRAKGHGTETRSRQKAQAKETKEVRRNDGSRGGRAIIYGLGKRRWAVPARFAQFGGAPNPAWQTPESKLQFFKT